MGIDEGHFFADLRKFCEDMISNGKTVIIAALGGTFERNPWPSVSEVIPLASNIKFLSAICVDCNGRAPFTHRCTLELEEEMIGGEEKYQSLCDSCYTKKNTTQ